MRQPICVTLWLCLGVIATLPFAAQTREFIFDKAPAARPLGLPNPNSDIDRIRLRDGRIALVYNNTTTGRSPMNLAESADGDNFTKFAALDTKP